MAGEVYVSPGSIMTFSRIYEIDGVTFAGIPEIADFEVLPGDLKHVVTYGDRLDALAHRYYGSVMFDWVIAVANDIRDMTFDLHEGDELRIPSPDNVKSIVK